MRVILLLTSILTSAWGYDPLLKGPGLSIELISENQTVTAGHPFTVGLHLRHAPKFHTYWKNPGQVGVPTAIDWTLPKGFTASEISWPYPEQTFMAEYPCHGYERDVTLLVTITPPLEIQGTSVTFSAKTSWMSCAKGCFPGFQNFSITLPTSETPVTDATATALIKKSRSELPKTDHKITAKLLSKTDAQLIKVLLNGLQKEALENLYLFSDDQQISSDQKQVITRQADGSVILKVPRSEFSPKGLHTLPGVLRAGSQHLAIEAKP